MSMYTELNDLQLDVSEYEEMPLTEIERKKWEKRVLIKLHQRKHNYSKKWIGLAAALLLAIGVTIPLGKVSLAQMPFVTGLIEHFINGDKPANYSAYKTAIGEPAVNAYGKLTLNEVLVDADRLLISSTFEPAKGVSFDYQTFLSPHVLVNGEDLQKSGGAQSIKVNDGMYTIYGDIKMSHLPNDGPLQIKITYDTISKRKRIAIEEPWVFNITVSTSQLEKDTKTFTLGKTITLNNGEKVTLKKVIVTPVSTLIYYDATEASESTRFKLISSGGKEVPFSEGYGSSDIGDTSYTRYAPIDLEKETYSLIPVDENDEEIGPEVQIQ
ncbi:hypothetical protein SAMN04487895_10786 [Paenibacillus sophorae]|uniref:DUF4179 domain-containing protein n=1 Tax=Paenibacillus sophorae TaxID=1333845 RepID=A0A1H8P964_9BACL|nr:DUF4179 domain-containing protein [Paenibacillus sophorae]QWU16473.1 DUF4179 domain-containing protein [Paenibacillus sophorae]SEO38083.1 hypothetical protein SAMN04487895_10786 [Paenibacillus sophorae]